MTQPRRQGELHPTIEAPPFDGLWYSLRRYYVDEFFIREVARLPSSARVLDLGGKRKDKRGRFDIERHDVLVTYVNLDEATQPDILADAAAVPRQDGAFDAVLCAELLEHVPEPIAVLREAHRLLRPGGTLLATTPFLHPLHADPEDYGRYTDHYWRTTLNSIGFRVDAIEKQGLMWSVLFDALRGWLAARIAAGHRPRSRLARLLVRRAVRRSFRAAIRRDAGSVDRPDSYPSHYTGGFAIIATRTAD